MGYVIPGRDGMGAGLGRKFFRRRRPLQQKKGCQVEQKLPLLGWQATRPDFKVQGS